MEKSIQFYNWEKEINKEWVGGYSAIATESRLVVFYKNKEVANINENMHVWGDDPYAVEQLEYMVNR